MRWSGVKGRSKNLKFINWSSEWCEDANLLNPAGDRHD
jgi:hypothetical protein